MIYAHPRHRAHRAAAQSHRATWPVVPEVGRGWHRTVICRYAGKSSPGPPRRTLLAPHPKVSDKMGGGVAGRLSRMRLSAALFVPPSNKQPKQALKSEVVKSDYNSCVSQTQQPIFLVESWSFSLNPCNSQNMTTKPKARCRVFQSSKKRNTFSNQVTGLPAQNPRQAQQQTRSTLNAKSLSY